MISEGKWEAKKVSTPGKKEFWITSATGRNLIARIRRNSDNDTEAESNAHLIAASKLLLAACKGLFSVLTKPNDTFHCPDEAGCNLDSCKDCPIIQPYYKAEKALAAAEPN